MSEFFYKKIEIPIPPGWTPEQLFEVMKGVWGTWYDDSMDNLFAYPGRKVTFDFDIKLVEGLRYTNPNEMIPGWSQRGIGMPNAKKEYPEYEELLLKKDVVAGLETAVTLTELSTKGAEEGWTDQDLRRWTHVYLMPHVNQQE